MFKQLASRAVHAAVDKAEDVFEDVVEDVVEDIKEASNHYKCARYLAGLLNKNIPHVLWMLLALGIYVTRSNATKKDAAVQIEMNDELIANNMTITEAAYIIYNILTS